MMNNFGKMLFSCVIFAAAAGVYAQINRGELEGSLAPVTFSNYEGPHARIDTREQIRGIGVPLGQAVKAGAERSGAVNRYFVIHAVSAPDGNKLDADIFGLGPDAGVDHIRNLRTILQGYLQAAYNYTEKDAALLAEYITVYNAVYRENWKYFSERYKTPVMGHLDPQKAGLSLRYREWPGKTLMVIPLGTGGLSSIDTSIISDERVVEELRQGDDRGIERRREMVDLKEREAEAAEQKAEIQREAVRGEERAIAEERAQVEKERQQIAEDRRQLEEKKSQSSGQSEGAQAQGTQAGAQSEPAKKDEPVKQEDPAKKEDLAKQEEAIAQREAEAQQKSEELDKRESEVASQKEEAKKQEEFAGKKTEEAQQDRESIAKDQQAIIDQGEIPQGLIGIVMERGDSALGRLVSYDPATRKELRRSPLETVYARTLIFMGGKIIAIAGENRGNGAIRLIEIHSRSLEMVKQGDDDLHPNSLIWVNGNDLYAITSNTNTGTLNLGRFNADLTLQARSAINIHPNAAVSIQQNELIIQKADGGTAFLNPADLTEK